MDNIQPLVTIFSMRKDIFALQMNNSNSLLAYNGALKTYNESMQSFSETLMVVIAPKASINEVPMAIIRWLKGINSLLKTYSQRKSDIFSFC